MTHAPGGLQAQVPRDTSFLTALKGKRADAGRGSTSRHKCYYCDEEGHFKERCPTRLKDFLKQWADKGNPRTGHLPATTNGRNSQTTSPAARKKQVKFAEASQTLPVVAESYGKKWITAIADDTDPDDTSEDQNLLVDVDLAALDEATLAALYEELQATNLLEDGLDFAEGNRQEGPTLLSLLSLDPSP